MMKIMVMVVENHPSSLIPDTHTHRNFGFYETRYTQHNKEREISKREGIKRKVFPSSKEREINNR